MKLPSGLSETKGCTGKVRVTVSRAGHSKSLSRRVVKVDGGCRFTSELRIKDRSQLGEGKGALRFLVRFGGNSRLLPQQLVLTARYT